MRNNYSARLSVATRGGLGYIAGMKLHRRGGFSLIELLVTFALMLIMSVMLYGFGSASHQRSQKKLCADNLQKIYLALQIYANDFKGALPQNTNAVTSEDALDGLVPENTRRTRPSSSAPAGAIHRFRPASRCGTTKSATPISWAGGSTRRKAR